MTAKTSRKNAQISNTTLLYKANNKCHNKQEKQDKELCEYPYLYRVREPSRNFPLDTSGTF